MADFLYKDKNGNLVFKNFIVTVHDEKDPDLEEFLKGKYGNYTITYNDGIVQFTGISEKKLFSRTYTVQNIYYDDGRHKLYIEGPIKGKNAKIFMENFEKILENPKNVYLIPYLEAIGTQYYVENVPYRATYYDKTYYVEHGMISGVYPDIKKIYISTITSEILVKYPLSKLPSAFNTIFECKTPQCILSKFQSDAKTIDTYLILQRELYDIVNYPNVYAISSTDDPNILSILVYNKNEKRFYRYYFNLKTELIFAVHPEDKPNDKLEISLQLFDFMDLLKKQY